MTITKYLDPKNDIAFHAIFGSEKNQEILIHFINDILDFTSDHAVKSVEFLDPIQDPEIHGKKQSIIDVLCKDAEGVQYIVEMQVCPPTGFENRALYYASKAYCRQAERGSTGLGDYANLKKVYFIAIADRNIFQYKKSYKSCHVIKDNETNENDLKGLSFTFIELARFNKNQISDLENITEKWCYFLKHAPEAESADVEKIKGSDAIIEQAYEALNSHYWTEEELIAYEQGQKRLV